MKKTLAILAVTLMAATSLFAADIDNCFSKIDDQCDSIRGTSRRQFKTLFDTKGAKCKMITSGFDESGVHFDQRIAFFDKNTIISVNLDKNVRRTCDGVTLQLLGSVSDSVIIDGRLYFAHSQGRVLVIGRNNKILELMNDDGNSYQTISGVSTAKDLYTKEDYLILERRGFQPIVVDAYKLKFKLNDRRFSVILAD